ncbi:MAG: hypothetical protein Kow00121_44780 [Elainellaceae cyanobacterium]
MLDQSTRDRHLFLEQNQQELAELLTFIDFAQGLTIGFIEVNQDRDKALLVAALRERLADTDVRLEVLNFSQEQDLRRLREGLIQRIERIQTDKKLVLLILGLEVAIGTDGVGAYPPILQDLNFVRDAYRQSLPHPLLFVLPDYAITRVSKYAPDFWAWQSGVFRFKTSEQQVEQLKTEAFEQPLPQIASSDNQAQIDQLKQLLMELHPTGKPIAPQNVRLCSEVYYKIGSAYLTQQQPDKARDYLQAGLKVINQRPDPTLSQSLHRKLGNAYEQMRQFDHAIAAYETALEMARSLDQSERISLALFDLGDVALEQRQFEQAKTFYQQSLAIDEANHDRYSQARTYHQLGYVAQELREYEQARSHFQQALDIFIEFNDRYSQARTYHQLGNISYLLREYEQARRHYQQALDIFIECNDRYEQASTYHQLGSVAQKLREYEQARRHYQQALDIFIEFNDRYEQAGTYHQLGMVAQALREYEQARSHFQQALDIFIEFNDRYSQASTYFQLGKVFEALEDIPEARTCYLQDLQITIEFNDEHGLGISLRNLARFHSQHPDEEFLATVAQLVNATVEEVRQAFENLAGDE